MAEAWRMSSLVTSLLFTDDILLLAWLTVTFDVHWGSLLLRVKWSRWESALPNLRTWFSPRKKGSLLHLVGEWAAALNVGVQASLKNAKRDSEIEVRLRSSSCTKQPKLIFLQLRQHSLSISRRSEAHQSQKSLESSHCSSTLKGTNWGGSSTFFWRYIMHSWLRGHPARINLFPQLSLEHPGRCWRILLDKRSSGLQCMSCFHRDTGQSEWLHYSLNLKFTFFQIVLHVILQDVWLVAHFQY